VHVLTILLLLPLLGAAVIMVLSVKREHWIRMIALASSGAALLFAWALIFYFDPSQSSMQFYEQYRWNPRLGTTYAVGVDGFSFPMILLATLLCFVALLASNTIKQRIKGYYLLSLLLESAMLGVFMA